MEETSEKNPWSGRVRRVLEQAITSAAHNRFGKADPGYIARDGGWGGPWTTSQVAHARLVVGASPAQWRWRQTDVRE